MRKPLMIDICCGRGGWSKGFIAAGAFNSRAKAEAKAATRKGAKVKSVRIGGTYRYLVSTPK